MHAFTAEFDLPLQKSLVSKKLEAKAIIHIRKPANIKNSIGIQAGEEEAGDGQPKRRKADPLLKEGDIVHFSNDEDRKMLRDFKIQTNLKMRELQQTKMQLDNLIGETSKLISMKQIPQKLQDEDPFVGTGQSWMLAGVNEARLNYKPAMQFYNKNQDDQFRVGENELMSYSKLTQLDKGPQRENLFNENFNNFSEIDQPEYRNRVEPKRTAGYFESDIEALPANSRIGPKIQLNSSVILPRYPNAGNQVSRYEPITRLTRPSLAQSLQTLDPVKHYESDDHHFKYNSNLIGRNRSELSKYPIDHMVSLPNLANNPLKPSNKQPTPKNKRGISPLVALNTRLSKLDKPKQDGHLTQPESDSLGNDKELVDQIYQNRNHLLEITKENLSRKMFDSIQKMKERERERFKFNRLVEMQDNGINKDPNFLKLV